MDSKSLPFALANVINMDDVYGVIGIGSYFRQIESVDDASDIDLIVIRKTKTLRKETIKYQEYLIDLTQCSFQVLKKLVTTAGDSLHWQENLSNGRVLLDNKELVSKFLSEMLLTEEMLIEIDDFSIREMKGVIDNCVRKITRHKSVVTQFYYISVWSQNCYNLLCYKNKVVPFKHKPSIDFHIKTAFPAFHNVIEQIGNSAVTEQRGALMDSFVETYIKDLFPHISPFGVVKELKFSGAKLERSEQTRIFSAIQGS